MEDAFLFGIEERGEPQGELDPNRGSVHSGLPPLSFPGDLYQGIAAAGFLRLWSELLDIGYRYEREKLAG